MGLFCEVVTEYERGCVHLNPLKNIFKFNSIIYWDDDVQNRFSKLSFLMVAYRLVYFSFVTR